MIENITIRNVASYSRNEQILSGLSNNNFFYGCNGAGKTTISRVIDNEQNYPECHITWRGGNKIDTFVYNKDFIEKNFTPSSQLKGIFTLGEANPEIVRKIQDTNSEIANLEEEIIRLQATLNGSNGNDGKVKEQEHLLADFAEKCWGLKKKYDEDFQNAFKGVRDKKVKFKERVVAEFENNSSNLLGFAELSDKSKTVFSSSLEVANLLPSLNYDEHHSLANSQILSKKIVGKEDIDLAALINKLNNSDWVRKGMEYLDDSGTQCPFCQQSIAQTLETDLSEYFDESYNRDINAINVLHHEYSAFSNRLRETLSGILLNPPKQLNSSELKVFYELLVSKMGLNIQHIENKKKEPSAVVVLDEISDLLKNISNLIDETNSAIRKHNNLVQNIKKEQESLIAQVWKFICNEIEADYKKYKAKNNTLEKAIHGLQSKITEKLELSKNKDTARQELEKDITSIRPTIDSINSLLKSFGFDGFRLSESENKGFYKIVRPDGKEVRDTLSEGEKTFITFLYFYHLLNGSNEQSSITKPRIVVFDDPVSSLDSDILFIVSNLIKGLFDDIRNPKSNIKQVFVLTHNVFFHKEVSFNPKRNNGVMKEETFWLVKKNNNETFVEKQTENPIMTSYELLWKELKSDNISNQTIQNTLRRILENYFKILGNIDKDDIINMFEGQEKLICASLFAWVNDGSHFARDDLYINADDGTVQKQLGVFKSIFEKSKHIEHYKMMMGDYELPKQNQSINDNAQSESVEETAIA